MCSNPLCFPYGVKRTSRIDLHAKNIQFRGPDMFLLDLENLAALSSFFQTRVLILGQKYQASIPVDPTKKC